ncbi:MAG: hypothetical protein ACOCV2_00215 [Persicimonas sp.]
MKINNASASLDELVARMESIEAPGQTKDSSPADDASASEVTGESVESEGPRAPLDERLLKTARDALQGRFDTIDQVRARVIDVILDERYSETLQAAGREGIESTVRAALESDPNVSREIDQMLVAAASELRR